MTKVCFIYDPEPNEKFLKILSKMTPGRSGIYKDIQGVTSIEEADYCVVIDTTVKNVPKDRTIYLQAHPSSMYFKEGYAVKVGAAHSISLDNEPAFGEWWLDASYDELKSLPPMQKTKELCCILSNARNIPGHKDRIAFVEKLCTKYPGRVDVYGRIKPQDNEPGIKASYKGELGPPFSLQTYWFGKDKVLSQYKYSLELEALSSPNYFSERIYDAMLMWTIPISWGCPNLDVYFPFGSFKSINIYQDGVEDEVMEFVNSGVYNVNQLSLSRHLLLDKFQIWAKIYNFISDKMRGLCLA